MGWRMGDVFDNPIKATVFFLLLSPIRKCAQLNRARYLCACSKGSMWVHDSAIARTSGGKSVQERRELWGRDFPGRIPNFAQVSSQCPSRPTLLLSLCELEYFISSFAPAKQSEKVKYCTWRGLRIERDSQGARKRQGGKSSDHTMMMRC